MSGEVTLKLTIRGGVDGSFSATIDKVKEQTQSLGKAGQVAGQQMQAEFSASGQAAFGVSSAIDHVRSSVLRYASVAAAAFALPKLAQYADTAGQLRARIQQVTQSSTEYAAVQERIEQVSRSAYAAVADVSEVFIRSAGPMQQLGFETQTTLDLTEALALGLVVSAANAESRGAAINAFGKAMQTGTLRGQEFNTVLTAAPSFIDAVGTALGKSRAELIGMAEGGELSISVLAGVASQLDELRAAADAMPVTLEDAMQRFRDSLMKSIDGLNQATGAMPAFTVVIDMASQNMDVLVTVGGIAVTVYGVRLVSAVTLGAARMVVMGLAARSAAVDMGIAAVAANGLSGALLTLVGGKLGAALLVSGGIVFGITKLAQITVEQHQHFDKLIGQIDQLTGKSIDIELRIQMEQGVGAREIEAQLEAVRAQATALWPEMDTLNMRIEALRGAVWKTADTWRDYHKAQADLAAVQMRSNSLIAQAVQLSERLAEAKERESQAAAIAAATQGLSEEVDKQVAALNRQAVALDATAAAMVDYDRAAFIAQKASEIGRQLTDAETAAIDKLYAKLQAAAAGLDAARAASEQRNEAQRQAKKATEEARVAKEALLRVEADHTRAMIEQAGAESESAAAIADYQLAALNALDTLREQIRLGLDASKAQAQFAGAMRLASGELLRSQAAAQQAVSKYTAQLRQDYAVAIQLVGMTEAARRREEAAIRAVAGAQKELEKITDATERARREAIIRTVAVINDSVLQEAEALNRIIDRFAMESPFVAMARDADLLAGALARGADTMGNAYSPEKIEEMRAALGGLRADMQDYATDQIGQGIAALKSLTAEGTNAYRALEVAQTALNLASAIGAIANQGMGDPYTAWARIAAMAALMGSLVKGLGAVRGGLGGGASGAAHRQATQGTGTVLGDADAKSASIARAADITASATSQLVGINRSMLRALTDLRDGLRGAGGLLARGAGNAQFGEVGPAQLSRLNQIGVQATNLLLGGLFGDLLTSISRTVLGARSRITDTGIRIGGGLLSDLLQGVSVGAYQQVESRSWWFGRTRTNTQVQSLGDEVATQFQLVLDSIAAAVRAGAEALGMDLQAVNEAIAAYQIAEINISTKGLSAEEAQRALEAVFSSIFDGLARSVVPWVGQFQRVGEGLGETLVRVATSVQVTQEAVRQLGITLDETDPERLAQISVGLVDLMGGIDEFISGMSSFVQHFAPEAHRFAVAQDALIRAFAQAGLEIPASRDAMWDLMQSLDATTESGREQIAMLLQLADVSDAYYRMVEQQAESLRRIDEVLADNAWGLYLDTLTGSARAVVELTRRYDDLRDSMLASGATTEQLAQLETQRGDALGRLLAAQIDEQMSQLEAQSAAFAPPPAFAARIEAIHKDMGVLITRMEMLGATEEQLAQIRLLGQLQLQAVLDEQAAALREYSTFIAGFGDLGPPLTDFGRSTRDIEQAMIDAIEQAHELAIAAGLQGASEEDLAQIHMHAARQAAMAMLEMERAILSTAESLGYLQTQQTRLDAVNAEIERIGRDPYASLAFADRLESLFEQRADLEAMDPARFEQAAALAVRLRDLAFAVGETAVEAIDRLGISADRFLADLGFTGGDIRDATVADSLVSAARLLGVELSDLAARMGVEVGALADPTSVINDAFERAIGRLPDALRAGVLDAFGALEAGDAGARESLVALIDGLPSHLRQLFEPLLDDIDPERFEDSLLAGQQTSNTYLASAAEHLAAIRAALDRGQPGPGRLPGEKSAESEQLARVVAAEERSEQTIDRRTSEMSSEVRQMRAALDDVARTLARLSTQIAIGVKG